MHTAQLRYFSVQIYRRSTAKGNESNIILLPDPGQDSHLEYSSMEFIFSPTNSRRAHTAWLKKCDGILPLINSLFN